MPAMLALRQHAGPCRVLRTRETTIATTERIQAAIR
jgi:hypothetical protein